VEYLQKAFDSVEPFRVLATSAVMYVLFPESAYLTAFCAVLGVMILDILTKYRAIAKNNGGLWKSIKSGKLNSHRMWEGTSHKIFDYLVIFIMVGLSYRVSPLEAAVTYLGTTVYLVIFFRECQSVVENLVEAGSDYAWLLNIIKKRKKKVLDNEGVVEDGKEAVDTMEVNNSDNK